MMRMIIRSRNRTTGTRNIHIGRSVSVSADLTLYISEISIINEVILLDDITRVSHLLQHVDSLLQLVEDAESFVQGHFLS